MRVLEFKLLSGTFLTSWVPTTDASTKAVAGSRVGDLVAVRDVRAGLIVSFAMLWMSGVHPGGPLSSVAEPRLAAPNGLVLGELLAKT